MYIPDQTFSDEDTLRDILYDFSCGGGTMSPEMLVIMEPIWNGDHEDEEAIDEALFEALKHAFDQFETKYENGGYSLYGFHLGQRIFLQHFDH